MYSLLVEYGPQADKNSTAPGAKEELGSVRDVSRTTSVVKEVGKRLNLLLA